MFRRSLILVSTVSLLSWLAASAVMAAEAPAMKSAQEKSSSEKPVVPPAAATVTGFRSAHFGMDEAAVRGAIAKDFGLQEKAITKTQNLADRTTVLSIKVPEVLASGGTADIAYILGYKSKLLTQVNIVWAKATDESLDAEKLVANGESLRSYFGMQGFDPKTVASNLEVRDGILLFRGADAEGRTTALMLHGTKKPATDKVASVFTPDGLLLFYLANARDPDVYRIPNGKF